MTAEERNRERVYALGRQGQMPFLTTAKQLLLASIPRVYRNDAPVKRFCKACGVLKPVDQFQPNGTHNGKPQVHQPCYECKGVDRKPKREVGVEVENKVCKHCGEDKHINEYHRHGMYRDGIIRYDTVCKTCDNKRRMSKHEANRR